MNIVNILSHFCVESIYICTFILQEYSILPKNHQYKDYIYCQILTLIVYVSHETVKFVACVHSIVMLVQFYTGFRLETRSLRKWPTKLLRYHRTQGAI